MYLQRVFGYQYIMIVKFADIALEYILFYYNIQLQSNINKPIDTNMLEETNS